MSDEPVEFEKQPLEVEDLGENNPYLLFMPIKWRRN
jgi:hypothetical protein